MNVQFHPHALARMAERGAKEAEVTATISGGEEFAAKFGRVGFRRNFAYNGVWQGKPYANKQVEVYGKSESGVWLVITVIVKFF